MTTVIRAKIILWNRFFGMAAAYSFFRANKKAHAAHVPKKTTHAIRDRSVIRFTHCVLHVSSAYQIVYILHHPAEKIKVQTPQNFPVFPRAFFGDFEETARPDGDGCGRMP